MSTMAFVQARMGSTRLPGKVLLDLAGKPVLQRVLERVARSRVDQAVLLTTALPEDTPLAETAEGWGFKVFRGSEQDVLDRFYQAAQRWQPDRIVRITADCPVMDPEVINTVLDAQQQAGADYCSNCLEETYPDGEDVEVFTRQALEQAWRKAELPSEREHVTPYIRNHPELFRQHSVRAEQNWGGKRWTLDNPEDYVFLKALYAALIGDSEFFGIAETLSYLAHHPELEAINGQIVRNEGYLKSLREDGEIHQRK
jgi:spore coat polysaccharide biosynthesis protein SpsF (cytidylyltransferase family)